MTVLIYSHSVKDGGRLDGKTFGENWSVSVEVSFSDEERYSAIHNLEKAVEALKTEIQGDRD